jgi:hypothetical protein
MYLWLIKDYVKKDPKQQNAVLGEIFDETPYVREDYVLDKLIDHIDRNYRKSKRKYYYSIW